MRLTSKRYVWMPSMSVSRSPVFMPGSIIYIYYIYVIYIYIILYIYIYIYICSCLMPSVPESGVCHSFLYDGIRRIVFCVALSVN